jgi:hypothetical protein
MLFALFILLVLLKLLYSLVFSCFYALGFPVAEIFSFILSFMFVVYAPNSSLLLLV